MRASSAPSAPLSTIVKKIVFPCTPTRGAAVHAGQYAYNVHAAIDAAQSRFVG